MPGGTYLHDMLATGTWRERSSQSQANRGKRELETSRLFLKGDLDKGSL